MLTRLYNALPASGAVFSFIKIRVVNAAYRVFTFVTTSVDRSGAIKVVKIAPRINIVTVFSEKLPADTAKKLLNEIMYNKGDRPRRSYEFLSFLGGMTPFLSMGDKDAMVVRKKHIIPYLHAMQSQLNYSSAMQDLITKMRKISISGDSAITVKKIISDHLLSLFSRSFLGVDFSEEMKRVLHDIEFSPVALLFGILPSWMLKGLPLIPSISKLRRNHNSVIKNFLEQHIESIKNDFQKEGVIEKNWLIDMICKKVGDLRLISKKQIEALADDPEIRMCIALVLGTTNLTTTVEYMLQAFFSGPLNKGETIASLILELESQSSMTPTDLLNKEKMPLFHATFLETLRLANSGFGLVRNTTQAIKVNDTFIPSHSIVCYFLNGMSFVGNNRYPANVFAPERFINHEGQLSSEVQLHEGWFTPFAIGPRMCAGQRIAEQIFKMYLAAFVQSIESFGITTVNFRGEEKDDIRLTAKAAARKELRVSVRYGFFTSRERESKEVIDYKNWITREEITDKIVSYCL